MIKRIFPLLFACLGGAGLSQFPEFAQQYTQRVGGAYEELKTVADGFRRDAAENGKTVEEAVAEYYAAGSAFFSDRGKSIETVLARETYLQDHYRALIAGGPFAQLQAFASGPDLELAQDTYAIYRPAVPLTSAGALHAALGFLAGYFVIRLPMMVFRRKKKPVAKVVRRT